MIDCCPFPPQNHQDLPEENTVAVTRFLPFTTALPFDTVHLLEYLLSTTEEAPLPHLCHAIAEYLTTIHREYKAFHNGGLADYNPALSVLERAPVVPGDIVELPPSANTQEPQHMIHLNMAAPLSGWVYFIRSILVRLNNQMPMSGLDSQQGLYIVFHQSRMCYVEMPDELEHLDGFAQLFGSTSAAEKMISDAQLWIAFTPALCSLLATAKQVTPLGIQMFCPWMFRSNRLIVEAHNWYMELKGAPRQYLIAVPRA
ncbi:hypothetical protein FS749_010235 [Ceratobasidium sp. UAMH 11750]|nr:hypothetical protein FS749_010235 [Ceratobasidium sp. UAMH 11750]